MFKYLFILFLLFTASSYVFASNDLVKMEARLQQKYGEDLKDAPFFLRFSFSKQFNKDWKESTYPERRNYLGEYEEGVVKQEKKDKEEARAQAQQEKEQAREKKEEARQLRNKLKAEAAQERAEQREQEERERSYNRALETQTKELEEMRRELDHRNAGQPGPYHPPAQDTSEGSY